MAEEIELAKLLYPKTWEEAKAFWEKNPGTGSLLDHAKALNQFTKEIYISALEASKASPGTGTVWEHGMALMKYAHMRDAALEAAKKHQGTGTVLDHAVMMTDFPEVYEAALKQSKEHPEEGDVRRCGLLMLKAALDAKKPAEPS